MTHDLRDAWRSLSRRPFVALVVVVSMAAGIGVNTVAWSWLEAQVLRPLPGVPDAAGLHYIEPRAGEDAGAIAPEASWLDYRDLREELDVIPDLIAFRMTPLYVGDRGQIDRVYGQLVSPNFFEGLGVVAGAGRFPSADEASVARPARVAVISDAFWQTRFERSPTALGATIRINDAPLTVVGVTPAGFQGSMYGLRFDLWIPAALAPVIQPGSRELQDRDVRAYTLMGRLAPGVPLAEAQRRVDLAATRLAAAFPATHRGVGAVVLPFWQAPRGPQRFFAGALLVLQGVLLLLWLAVSVNVANLMLARASERQHEMDIRAALGAGRRRLARLVLTECLLLSILGSLAGAGAAVWGTRELVTLPLMDLPLGLDAEVTATGWLVALMLGAVGGLIVGAVPALRAVQRASSSVSRTGSSLGAPGRPGRALMGAQAALALTVLVIGTAFLQAYAGTRGVDPGFEQDGIVLAAYDLGALRAGDAGRVDVTARILEQVARIPGVAVAAVAQSVPLDIHGLARRPFEIEGRAPALDGRDLMLVNVVTPAYFETTGIPLRAGRTFVSLRDTEAPREVVVNETFVDRYLPRMEPLGRVLQSAGQPYVIVGVCRDSTYNAFGEPPTPVVYFSYRDVPRSTGELHVRSVARHDVTSAEDIQRAVAAVSGDVPVMNVRTVREHVESNLVLLAVPARLFAVLSPLLLILASMGIYAVTARATEARTAEIGLRLALGATPRGIARGLVIDHVLPVATGVVAGWSVSLIVLRIFAPESVGGATLLGMPALLMAVAVAASWLPARRAARLNPLAALRHA